jgi:hypothetical protein
VLLSHAQHIGDDRAPIATLRDKVLIAKALHQRGPCLRNPFGPPAGRGWLAGNPYPGIDGITRWKASDALPPWAVGSVSGPMIFSCSITEPGQPCVTISGNASSCLDRTWMKWISSPSISVMKFGER